MKFWIEGPKFHDIMWAYHMDLKMIERTGYLQKIEKIFVGHKIVGLLGARQTGKTTIARQFASLYHNKNVHFFDLEDPLTAERFQNPRLVLQDLQGLIILDEIQCCPHLFPLLRILVDEDNDNRYLILGSASPDLVMRSAETLAGRIGYVEVNPFGLLEIEDTKSLFVRGGYPKSLLAADDEQSWLWRENYVRTFLERDLPQLGIRIPALALRRFWMMLTHVHGQIFQESNLALSMGVTEKTAKNYVDILTGTYMIRQLPPWFENIGKRQVKRPKIYFRDSGIYNFLSNLISYESIQTHPKLGIIWEGFALEQIIRKHDFSSENCFFWAVHQQAEIDLLVFHKGKRLGFEFKYTDIPKMTKSLHIAKDLLKLDEVSIVYPGKKEFAVEDGIFAKPL